MTVYIVTKGEYSDKYNVAVFTTRELAEAFIKGPLKENTEIEERDLDPEPK